MSAKKFVLKRSRASDPKFENLVNSHEKKVKVAQSCPALCELVDCILHEILQARILEWVAFPSSGDLSQPRD